MSLLLMPLIMLVVIGLAFATLAVWLALFVRSHQLLWRFCREYPREAEERIPYAHTHMAHPGKLFFFLRRSAVPLLQSNDKIWKMRQPVVVLLCASVLLPASMPTFGILAGFVCLLVDVLLGF